jgi:hypothetical protein
MDICRLCGCDIFKIKGNADGDMQALRLFL